MGGMTQDLFRQNAYLTECTATVTAITPLGLELDRTVFYPLGGGQAGDTGVLVLADGSQIAITLIGEDEFVRHESLDSCCKCRCPAVSSLLKIDIYIVVHQH